MAKAAKISKIKPRPAPLTQITPLDSYVGYALRRAQVSVFDEFIREFGALDLRPGQFSVLLVISKNPGLNQSEVAASLGIQRANFVALINRLEKRGLVTRRKLDLRSYALHLSRKGAALLARALEKQAELEARIETRLGAGGKARLMALLGKIS